MSKYRIWSSVGLLLVLWYVFFILAIYFAFSDGNLSPLTNFFQDIVNNTFLSLSSLYLPLAGLIISVTMLIKTSDFVSRKIAWIAIIIFIIEAASLIYAMYSLNHYGLQSSPWFWGID